MDYEKVNCLKQENIVNFLAGEGTESERISVETHLAGCRDCRLNFTNLYANKEEEFYTAPAYLKEKAKNLPQKEKVAKPFFSFIFTRQTAFAMASFVVLFSLVGFWVLNSTQIQIDNSDVFRQGGQNSNTPILLSPENNASLLSEEIEFKWQKLDGANSYILIVSDEKGDIVFEKQTKEESLNVKGAKAKLTSDKHYFWYVRAKFIDGKITETSPRKFTFKN